MLSASTPQPAGILYAHSLGYSVIQDLRSEAIEPADKQGGDCILIDNHRFYNGHRSLVFFLLFSFISVRFHRAS